MYSHHVFAYLIWQCLKGKHVPAIKLEQVNG